ncbi:unnamed protein product [Darwinula stevensoni]|uniref:Bestrophin homolog n=1 Tax=Darwinula stevensoni TaxID=69355 RepID=A0A7R8XAU6_9CRUS|nr:unnamed protein product [Darwinula stevensoni]CAG0887088.1 unnamed protein product [Darwinula stevensoni]
MRCLHQVVTIATYSYYCALVFGSQSVEGDNTDIDDINAYAPITSIFLLVLYVGWLKVAQSLIDPYGEDDVDFELNWLIDRNVKVSHLMGEGVNTDLREFTWHEMFPWLYDRALGPNYKLRAFANVMDKDKETKGTIEVIVKPSHAIQPGGPGWQGSIYKLIGLDIVIWLLFFYTFNCLYRFLLDDDQRDMFEKVVVYCRDFNSNIPLTFVLGFYVTTVLNRWWSLWNSLPWPDDVIHYLTIYLNGQVQGLMEEGERRLVEVIAGDSLRSMFWIPHVWATNIAHQARVENRIQSDLGLRGIVDALTAVRRTCSICQHVEFIEVPIVYSQVVTIATYSYYCALVFGSQSIDDDNSEKDVINTYAPITSVFLLVLYIGWLKVAESLIDPYGEDDADFELNWLIDRHMKVSYVMGEGLNTGFKQYTWNEMFPWLYDEAFAPNSKLRIFADMMDEKKKAKSPELVVTPIPPNNPDLMKTTTLFRILKTGNTQVVPPRVVPSSLPQNGFEP